MGMNISAKFGSNLFCGFRKKDENVKLPYGPMLNYSVSRVMAAILVHNVFSLAEILKIFLSETTKSIEL
jgi:hypothetical protein